MDRTEVTPDLGAISTVFESWYRALEDGDVDRLISLVTPDVIVKPPGAAPLVGKDVLAQALSAFLKEHSESVDFEVQEVEISGHLAFARILERATIRIRSGEESSTVNGMHLTILRRQPDGEWLIARNISSLVDTA